MVVVTDLNQDRLDRAAVVKQCSDILGRDGCLNFFAGPTDKKFEATMNFYDVHYNSTHVMGTTGGKKLIYTHLSMPLTALEDLRKAGEERGDARYSKLADIVDAHKGLWCPEAEEYLLGNFTEES